MSIGRLKFFVNLALAALVTASFAPRFIMGGAVQPAGVIVDADGVLTKKVYTDPTGELTRSRLAAAREKLSPDVMRPSPLRKISLNRLEAAVADRLAHGEFETEEMKYLAGLTSISHVFFYPETQDIVIAGPAEGFYEDISGRVVGLHTGRVVVELQDLVAALRAYPPAGDRTSVISVSIDPTQEGLQRLQQFLAEVGGRATPADTAWLVQGLQKSLGHQEVSIRGVSDKTHFAQVLVEADYRMKLIGIGLEEPPVKIVSYVSKANPRSLSRNAMQRWYFTPSYEGVKVSEDGLAMQMIGRGVKLVCEHELVTGGGERVASASVDPAAQAFAASFTKMYPDLAERSPVYAQMRNLIDLSVAAAYIQQQDYYGQAGWEMPVFGDERQFPIETYTAPKTVESAVNAIWKGRRLMTPIGGGVNIQPRQAITSERLRQDNSGTLTSLRSELLPERPLGDEQWWWD